MSSPVHEIPAEAHTLVLTTVSAPVEACFDVAVDLERYPEWVKGLTSVEVKTRDDQGRPSQARFEATAIGRASSFTLAYDLSSAPGGLSWTMVDGDVTSRLDGSYRFEPAADEAATDVTYELYVDLAIPLPGYVRRRAEDKIVEAALRAFKARVESLLA